MGRQIGLIIQNLPSGRTLTYDEIANILYQYSLGKDAYYRISFTGTIIDINIARPRFFQEVMDAIID